MFQQGGNIVLHLLELVELQVRIGDGEHVPGFGLLVNEDALAVPRQLFLHLDDSLSLQHHRENVTRRNITRIIQFDEFAQQRLGGVFLNRFRRGHGRLICPLPIGNKSFAVARAVAVLLLPAGFTNIRAPEILFCVEQERVVRLFINEAAAAGLAGMAARLNVPFVHGKTVARIGAGALRNYRR